MNIFVVNFKFMEQGFLHLHSFLRYVVLILGLIAIFKAITGFSGSKSYGSSDEKISKFFVLVTHLQILLGLIIYFTFSPWFDMLLSNGMSVMKDPVTRFWTIEHLLTMLIAAIIITIGRAKSKRASDDVKKHKTMAIYYTIGFILILSAIPWPFREALGKGWF